jgi:hypothetical protein
MPVSSVSAMCSLRRCELNTKVYYPHPFCTQPSKTQNIFISEIRKYLYQCCNCGAMQLQAWTGPECSRRLRLPRFQDSWQMTVESLSALCTDRLYYPGNIPVTHFC